MSITPSILDRLLLLDDEEYSRLDLYDETDLEDDVRRNLERLFNTRCRTGTIDNEFKQLRNSVFEYGILDFTVGGFGGPREQAAFCRSVAAAITRSEPRLLQVSVRPLPSARQDRVFRFQIYARLRVRPRPREVVYTTGMELATYSFEVKNS